MQGDVNDTVINQNGITQHAEGCGGIKMKIFPSTEAVNLELYLLYVRLLSRLPHTSGYGNLISFARDHPNDAKDPSLLNSYSL